MSRERERLKEEKERIKYWTRWGPYVSARQWGTVREDYSQNGDAWHYFTYDMSHYRAYRWGEDGIGGLCDNHQRVCFALTLWNRKDPHLKERYFGLIPSQGNHGEDVKELYYYLDNVPTHSYMKFLYKYPHERFPYEELVEKNKNRSKHEPEFEIYDTEAFKDNRYFDVFIEYAKKDQDDTYIRLTVENRSNEAHPLDLLPTLWCRNTWSTGEGSVKPNLKALKASQNHETVHIREATLGEHVLYANGHPELLFTENETNMKKLDSKQKSSFSKDGISDYIVNKDISSINPNREGTKMACHYSLDVPGNGKIVIQMRLTNKTNETEPFNDFDHVFELRKKEADEFYDELIEKGLPEDLRSIQRQAFSGMLWNKQFYYYVITEWLQGNQTTHPPLPSRRGIRNEYWTNVYSHDVLSVPDDWEYPWFAAWDSSFHMVVFALIDPDFAKKQLTLLTREWYMNPNGQLPAYEWNFSDVNPPVHAWALWRVYKIEKHITQEYDTLFLERGFQKLIMNFTWWINRKDDAGKNIFQGGFLGMDNISVFNRSENLPKGGSLYQSDATSWMAMYCLSMLTMALDLAMTKPSYEDIANKFYQHFLHIAEAINHTKEGSFPLWDEEDGFFYDVFVAEDGRGFPLKVRSMVGLVPLLAVTTLEQSAIDALPNFKQRMEWFINNRQDLCGKVACMKTPGIEGRKILSILGKDQLRRVLKILLDEKEFLSPYGIRSVSKYHAENPYVLHLDGKQYSVDYEPAESTLDLFGGNSNWRGPIWFPLNMLIIESLQKYHHYHGDEFKVEFPTGSGNFMTLWQVAAQLSHRLVNLFAKDKEGKRPIYAHREKFQGDPHFQNYILFNEYFHGETGEGLGASHQTGWTGLVAKLIKQLCDYGNV